MSGATWTQLGLTDSFVTDPENEKHVSLRFTFQSSLRSSSLPCFKPWKLDGEEFDLFPIIDLFFYVFAN